MQSFIEAAVAEYAHDYTKPVPDLLEQLREETYREMSLPQMQVGRIEGRFLKTLVQLMQARRVLEIGMFTGYSALMLAAGLPADGQLITCDIDPKAAAIARRYFDASPYGNLIEIRLGPALETIATLSAPFDLVFIDADKTNYPNYYEACLPLLREGGLLIADNVLWSGKVVAPVAAQDADTLAINEFNRRVQQDNRVENICLTVRDGVMLVRKKAAFDRV
jgi:caffeoyl-CoA O-methyltransferase